jgi:NAD(P)-dependent dehydrogenase (short-subunit alcohol dehydrogenase family)
MIKLDNKVILVTGSSRGFGRSMAYSFAARGANVVAVALEKEELDDLSEQIQKNNGSVYTICTDLSKENEIISIQAEVIDEFGSIDSIVNNAAVSLWKKIEDTSTKEWDYVFAVNIRAPFLLAKLFLDDMKKKGGNIINITSRSAEIGFIAEIAFSPTKWALEGLTQCLALELQPYNIAVNSLKVASPPGKRLKPTGITLSEVPRLPIELVSSFSNEKEMSNYYGDAWAFLTLQKANGITGQRLDTKELAYQLKTSGWQATVSKWSSKLTQATYSSYDFPQSVAYQKPDGGTLKQEFKFR